MSDSTWKFDDASLSSIDSGGSDEHLSSFSRNDEVKSSISILTTRKILVPLLCSVCVLVLFVVIFCSSLAYFTLSSSQLSQDGVSENTSEEYHFHKYLWVEKSSGQSKTFQSMKEVNQFALYPLEHGVEVYPMLFEHNHDEHSLGTIGKGRKEYVCSCDLEEVREYFEDESSRRGITSQNTRRVVVVSTGLIIAGAISVLMMLYKTNEIQLRIFANYELEAEEFAAEEVTSRIMSEVEGEKDYSRGNPYWDEMKEDCEKCEKFRVKQLEDALRKEQLKVEELKARLGEEIECEEVEVTNTDEQEGKDELLRCHGGCQDEKSGESTILQCFLLPETFEWNSDSTRLVEEDFALYGLSEHCENVLGRIWDEDSFTCESIYTHDLSYFKKQDPYDGSDKIDYKLDFEKFCNEELRGTSCLQLFKDSMASA